ncbi:OmpA family protein [Roseobacter sp. HKCCA0434]|uniref:OmpA family protein n=1 Tax=Roseobacter sp. HKCCA0434 TaxID=3079297 RepID=UPI002905F502|nr:OmpA family protein [Roseobacter sp. HKCCA0434]
MAVALAACGGEDEVIVTEPVVDVVATDYTVYFGFDRADLTAEGQQTVADASGTANAIGANSVSVVGHTDTVGSVAYNQALSEARAATVVGAMIGNGVNPAIITASGRSELDLAVPTADGVREPRNRRVEISAN